MNHQADTCRRRPVHCVLPTAATPLTLQLSISRLKSPSDCSTAKWLLAVWTQKWCKAENIAAYNRAPKLATASLDLITSQTFLVSEFLKSWQWQIFQSICENGRVYNLIHFSTIDTSVLTKVVLSHLPAWGMATLPSWEGAMGVAHVLLWPCCSSQVRWPLLLLNELQAQEEEKRLKKSSQ